MLGPSEDGGYYLIGLREPRAALFADMAWSTEVVFEETMRRASALGLDVGLLPAWFDVDTAADLERLEASLAAPGSGARHTRRFFARAARGGQAVTPESRAPQEARERTAHWKRWGPYVSERQWGTVREDYSRDGTAWEYLPHDHARSRAYRWGEDGIAGISDNHQRLCFAWAFWNGRDPILKERLFGLSGPQGNHGEDVKECYFYLDSTPTHSYMKYLYKYPQAAFPYEDLVEENRRRGRGAPEYELLDTGVFDEDRYWDILIEYAKAGVNDILIRVTATNRGPERRRARPAADALVPQYLVLGPGRSAPHAERLGARRRDRGRPRLARHALAGRRRRRPNSLFTDNDTNFERLWGAPNGSPYVKDGIGDHVVRGVSRARQPRAHRHQGRAPLSGDARPRRVERSSSSGSPMRRRSAISSAATSTPSSPAA